MLAGSTGDRIGRRRTFQTGLAVFTLGSLLCSLAPGLGWLVAFRMVQAVGGSMLNPVAMSIITNTFVAPAERARAIGVWGGVIGISMALGPLAGGALVASVGWRGIFWVNIPVGLAALVLTALFVPESRAPHPRRVDPVGQLLVIVSLASLTYAIIEGPNAGWTSARIIGFFLLAAAAAATLIRYEPRHARASHRHPVLPQRAVLRRDHHRGERVRRAGRLPVPEHPVPAGCARLLGASTRGCTCCRWRDDGDLRAAVRPDRRRARAAAAADRGRDRDDRRRADADRPDREHAHGLADHHLPGVRPRLRLVNAPITNTAVSGMPRDAGRRRGGGRLDQPPGGLFARRRGDRARR